MRANPLPGGMPGPKQELDSRHELRFVSRESGFGRAIQVLDHVDDAANNQRVRKQRPLDSDDGDICFCAKREENFLDDLEHRRERAEAGAS